MASLGGLPTKYNQECFRNTQDARDATARAEVTEDYGGLLRLAAVRKSGGGQRQLALFYPDDSRLAASDAGGSPARQREAISLQSLRFVLACFRQTIINGITGLIHLSPLGISK